LAELQAELNKRVDALSERRKTVEMLDKKLLELVDQQASLDIGTQDDHLHDLKLSLASRTKEELDKIEKKKQGYVLW
jgi:hypothetical protein